MTDRIRKSATNSTVYTRTHRRDIAKKYGVCDRCRPHKGENATRRKHGSRKKRSPRRAA